VRKVIVYLAASLDGYIAGPNGDMSFLDSVQQEREDYGYFQFTESVDTVVMGRKTYDWVMGQVPEFPHADKKTYIITRTERPQQGNLHGVKLFTDGLPTQALTLISSKTYESGLVQLHYSIRG
jgi:dihydrofolate reductase